MSQPDLVPTNKNGGLLVGNRSLFKYEPSSQCGGALRLTASVARLTGAAWYSRKVSSFHYLLHDDFVQRNVNVLAEPWSSRQGQVCGSFLPANDLVGSAA